MKTAESKNFLRIVSLILCLAAVFSLTSCKKEKTITISIPDIFLNDTQRSDLSAYCKSNEFISAESNAKKGKIKITMTQVRYDTLLVKMGMTTISSIGNMIESETFPYFKEIGQYNSDFSEIEIKVDGKKYKQDATASLLALSVSESCLMYLAYTTKKNPSCTVKVTDIDTDEILYNEKIKMA